MIQRKERKMKASGPKLLLHAEGLGVLVAACLVYHKLSASWILFAVLFLAPDISMIGYFFGKKVGALCYNSAHTYIVPLLLGGIGYFANLPVLTPLALIWIAHIGFDRLLGYGLKYPTDFKDTHLSRV
jgi:hypothetical protein